MFKIYFLYFKFINNNKKFLIIDFIAIFNRIKVFTIKYN